jgi:hypothetical protein
VTTLHDIQRQQHPPPTEAEQLAAFEALVAAFVPVIDQVTAELARIHALRVGPAYRQRLQRCYDALGDATELLGVEMRHPQ